LYGDSIYNLQHYQGTMVRIDVKTGEEQGGPFRLAAIRDVYASPVGAANRIYVTSRDGVTQVMTHGDVNPRMLATNPLDDSCGASAARAGRALWRRRQKPLYCLAAE